jgi:large subunit ribosomal protein L22
MKASLHNYRQAPRKMRLVADSIKGKRVSDALVALTFMPKKAAEPLKKLVESAVANARVKDAAVTAEDLRIGSIVVNQGITMVRYMPRAFGRASPIRRHASHVNLVLVAAKKKSAGADAQAEPAKAPKATKAKTAKPRAAATK